MNYIYKVYSHFMRPTRTMNNTSSSTDSKNDSAPASDNGSAAYWTEHMVARSAFNTAEDSLAHFHWRNAQYPGYIDLMPVSNQDEKIVLDYGCGPGNDVVGLANYSNTSKIIAIDVSRTALSVAQQRLALHNKTAEFIHIDENTNAIPLPDESIDYIHTSGVLHHCKNLDAVLMEFHRILKHDGTISVMVYNSQSLWLHLYTAWICQLDQGKYQDLSVKEAFRRTTDGEECPISHCYTPSEFISLVNKHGFEGSFKGASISIDEMRWLGRRFDAIADRRLPAEHRNFLSALTFDEHGIPRYEGVVAGINACYSFKKSSL